VSDQRMGQAVSEPNWKSMYIRCVTMFTEVGVRLGLEEPDPEDTFDALDELKERAEKAENERAWLYNIAAGADVPADRREEVDAILAAERERLDSLRERAEAAERELAELRAELGDVADRADEVKKRAQARGENTSALHFRGLARWVRAIAEKAGE